MWYKLGDYYYVSVKTEHELFDLIKEKETYTVSGIETSDGGGFFGNTEVSSPYSSVHKRYLRPAVKLKSKPTDLEIYNGELTDLKETVNSKHFNRRDHWGY